MSRYTDLILFDFRLSLDYNDMYTKNNLLNFKIKKIIPMDHFLFMSTESLGFKEIKNLFN